ncbi:MAG: helix-turn-helix transcriptional regulator, partial [Planctomycetota bacterium]
MSKTTDAYEIAYARFVKGKPRMENLLREEEQRLKLAACLREIRENAGLSQTELAKRIGTTGSVISRLEDPDYEGHSLKTLQRIVSALGMGLELTLVQGCGRTRRTKAVVLAAVPAHARRAAV